MKIDVKKFFQKVISNDNVKESEVENKQKKTISIIIAIIVIMIFLGAILTTPQNTVQKNNISGFSIIQDGTKDNIAQNKWVQEGSQDLKIATERLNELDHENRNLHSELKKLKEDISNFKKEQQSQVYQAQKYNKEQYNKILAAGDMLKKQQEEAIKKLNEQKSNDINNNNTNDNAANNFPIPEWVNKENLQKAKITDRQNPIVNVNYEETYIEEEFLNNSLIFQNFEQKSEENKQKEDDKEIVSTNTIEIPATSIIKAALISGFDAPTLAQAKNNPAPIVLKITDLSILANRHNQDLRDCFLLAEGYGDLASERAYLRTNTLHCINDNNDNIVVDFNGFIAGEDGKNGLRGRIVTKQGALIGRTIIAGVLQGIGDAFGSNGQVNIIGAEGVTKTNDNDSLSNAALANKALGTGISKASEKLADFYLKMADQISPVIEISAGREVDVIVTKSVNINLEDTKKYKSNLNREEDYDE